MIDSLHIKRFRAFQDFFVEGLERINLVVGANNSGKTSVLEAVHLIGSRGDLFALQSITGRRGERFWSDSERTSRSEIDIGHLFYGHEFPIGADFQLVAKGGAFAGQLDAEVVQFPRSQPSLFDEPNDSGTGFDPESRFPLGGISLKYSVAGFSQREPTIVPITIRGGMPLEYARRSRPVATEIGEIEFISTSGLSAEELVTRFDAVAGNQEEELVYEALRCIDSGIERLVTAGSEIRRSYQSSRGFFYAKLRNVANRIPLGVMGDGMWRMLAIALALVRARNGILLIDEIDTGLHHSVMKEMWKLIDRAGAPDALNVQVFATTHSYDCVRALSSICRDAPFASHVSIQRIERDASASVAINEEEVSVVHERDLEVR